MQIKSEIQTLGALIVLGCFAAAEAALHLLEAYPSWEFAWRLNLDIFKPFTAARNIDSPKLPLFGSQALYLDLMALTLVLAVRVARFRFGIAVFTNLSFGLSLTLAYVWVVGDQHHQTVSLVAVGVWSSQSALLVWLLLIASSAACMVSHISFVRAIRRPEP